MTNSRNGMILRRNLLRNRQTLSFLCRKRKQCLLFAVGVCLCHWRFLPPNRGTLTVSAGNSIDESFVVVPDKSHIDDGLNKGDKSDVHHHNGVQPTRVAICVTGQPRTLNMQLDDPVYPKAWDPMISEGSPTDINKTVAESIQTFLYPSLDPYGFDVFMRVSTTNRGTLRSPTIGDTTVCESLRPRTSTDHQLFCNVTLEVLPKPELKQMWKRFYGYKKGKMIRQLLIQVEDQLECWKMVQAQQSKSGQLYSHIIRLRTDMQFRKPFPTPLENIPFAETVSKSYQSTRLQRSVFYVPKEVCCCGNEDQFAIGRMEDMTWYFNRYTDMQTNSASYPATDGDARWTAETYLEEGLSRFANATLRAFPSNLPDVASTLDGCIVKPRDRTTKGNE